MEKYHKMITFDLDTNVLKNIYSMLFNLSTFKVYNIYNYESIFN